MYSLIQFSKNFIFILRCPTSGQRYCSEKLCVSKHRCLHFSYLADTTGDRPGAGLTAFYSLSSHGGCHAASCQRPGCYWKPSDTWQNNHNITQRDAQHSHLRQYDYKQQRLELAIFKPFQTQITESQTLYSNKPYLSSFLERSSSLQKGVRRKKIRPKVVTTLFAIVVSRVACSCFFFVLSFYFALN